MKNDVYVAGVGMVPFTKPGASEPYPQMASKAVKEYLLLNRAWMCSELVGLM